MALTNAFGAISLDSTLQDVRDTMRFLRMALVRPIWLRPGTGAIRVAIENSTGAVDTLGAVTTVTNVATISALGAGSFPVKQTLMDCLEEQTWQSAVRARIT